MEAYKPKRFEIIRHQGSYSLGLNIATEQYSNELGRFRDFYISIGFIFFQMTLVLVRTNKKTLTY